MTLFDATNVYAIKKTCFQEKYNSLLSILKYVVIFGAMPEVNDFITREFRKYMQKHDRMIAPYQIKITPDWLRGRVKIKITEIDMECAFQ